MLPATDNGPSVLKVIIPFTDPAIVGCFVYHCHAVDHEDKGMMGSSRSLGNQHHATRLLRGAEHLEAF
jgi:hypothetical protein